MAVFAVQAEEVCYTLEPATGSNNSYAGNCDITIDGITWNLTGNSTMLPWRIGGKNLTGVDRALYSKTPINSAVSKVVLTTGTASSITVNSAKLLVATNADFSGAVEYSFTFAASTNIEIPVSAAADSYYKFVFNVTVEGSNKFLQFTKAEFYADGYTPAVPTLSKPTFTPADGATFEESLDVAIEAEEGATIYYTTNGDKPSTTSAVYTEPFSITETTTVKAYAVKDGSNDSQVATATYTKLVPVDPNAKEVEATISFASTAQRVSQDEGQQVWQNEGVTFTNNKANSSNDVANHSDPVRLYGGSNVVIEHEAMTKVLFVCSSSSYATALGNSISTAATVDGSNVTVTFINPVDEFTIESLSAQVRLNSLTVTYLTTQKVVKTPVITPESYGFYAGENVEVTITAEEGTIYYTTDGNDPTTSSEVYSVPFTISETTTVKAIAVVDGTESEVATAVYTKGIEGTVTDAFDAYVDGERLPAAVTGYIVGYVNGSAVGDEGADCVFGAESVEKNTNILIADDPYEIDYTKCLAVQLPNNEIRTALNLMDNPNNYQVKVVIKGSLEKYLNTAGLKDLVAGELVDELYQTLTVSEAGWSTLYLGFNARIPSTVEAYIVKTVNDGWVTLTQVTGVLPANTGVIVKAAAGDYKFYNEATATADVTGNLLDGSLYNKNINEEAYVLSAPDGVVGLYKAEMTDGTWLNNANKAYLPASAVPNKTAAFYGFEWNGTTGVEGVVAEGAQDGAIYDITGRRVKAITAPGIYIVNGKKVVK